MRVQNTSQGRNVRCSRAAGQMFSGQQGVHRARTESFQIQGDKLETERLEDAGQFGCHLRTESARQFGLGNLDTDHFAMVTDAELLETKPSERIFTTLH